MHLTHLTVEDLRPISRLNLDLAVGGAPRRRVILLGINGAGKTTTLEAVAYAFQRLQPIEGHEPLLRPSDVRRRPEGIEPTDTPVAVVSLDTVLSSEEHAAARETQPSAARSGTLRFELGTRPHPAGPERGSALALQDLLDAGLLDSFASGGWHDAAAAAAGLASKAPCVYLPADRGVLTYRNDLPLADVVRFDPREGAVSKDRGRFAALAARMALAFAGNKSLDETGALARMWKVLARYLPGAAQARGRQRRHADVPDAGSGAGPAHRSERGRARRAPPLRGAGHAALRGWRSR